ERNPRKADPSAVAFRTARRYDYTRGALTLRTPLGETSEFEWRVQVDYQDLDHPLSFAIIDQTTYTWGTEGRYIQTAPLFGLPSRFTAGAQYFSTQQRDVQFATLLGRRGDKVHNQANAALNLGVYAEEQLDVLPALTAIAGARAQYAKRDVRDKFLADGNQSGDVDYFAFIPRLGAIG